MSARVSPGERLLATWRQCSALPFGAMWFTLALRATVPYSGALGPRVLLLEPGHVRVALADRRGVRNHLDSIHAIALANLGELTSGMAMTTALPGDVRSIVTALNVEYHKKARGTVIAESRVIVPKVTSPLDHDVKAEIHDVAGDLVAIVTARWLLGPRG